MSLILAAKAPSAIIVASDRRLIGTKDDGSLQCTFVRTDSDQKTFLVNGRFALSYCGNASIKGLPTSKYLREAVESMSDVASTFQVADALSKYWEDRGINDKPVIIISGYNAEGPSIIEMKPDDKTPLIYHRDDDQYGVVYHGDIEICRALIESGTLQFSLMQTKDMVDLFDLLITTTAKLQALQDRTQTVSVCYDMLCLTNNSYRWLAPPEIQA